MSRGLSSATKADLYAPNCSGVYLVLLTITHPDITTIRLVNDRQSLVSGGDTYTPLAFTVRLPTDSPDGNASAVLILDNVDQSIVAAARSITTPASVTIEVVKQSAPDTILVTYSDLRLTRARISATTIEFDLSADPVVDESYPGLDFTPLSFPAGFDR